MGRAVKTGGGIALLSRPSQGFAYAVKYVRALILGEGDSSLVPSKRNQL